MTAACLSDIHIAEPWMGLAALRRLVADMQACKPDIMFLLGDNIAALPVLGRRPDTHKIAEILGQLQAPLGVHTILGNHDWRDDRLARQSDCARNGVAEALTQVGLSPLINDAAYAPHGDGLWIVGLDSQQGTGSTKRPQNRHRPEVAFAKVPPEAQVLVLAHEPDWFAQAHPRAPIQLSGHTHGGQANSGGRRPLTPSRYGDRYAYGHITEGDRHLIVSGGAGYTLAPLRLNQPPEITMVTFCGPAG